MTPIILREVDITNFKRLKAAHFRPTGPVTRIVGNNGAGKTSAIDAIAAALAGLAESPELPIRNGADRAEVTIDLGEFVVVRRWTGKGSTLTVTAKDGAKYPKPQAILDGLWNTLCVDPLAFSRQAPKEQARTLASVAGIDLDAVAADRKAVYDQRTAVNRQLKTVEAQLAALPAVEAPEAEVSIAELMKEIEAGEAANIEADGMARLAVQRRNEASAFIKAASAAVDERHRLAREKEEKLAALVAEYDARIKRNADEHANDADECERLEQLANDAKLAADTATRVDLAPLRKQAVEAEETNAAVRQRKTREAKAAEVERLERESAELTRRLEAGDQKLAEKINAAALPIPGLTINPDGVSVNGIPFAQCSGAEKLRLSVAIAIALNPKLRLMLIRDGSLLDADGMKLLADMAESAGAQVLIERVQTGSEVGVEIADGEVVEHTEETTAAPELAAV